MCVYACMCGNAYAKIRALDIVRVKLVGSCAELRDTWRDWEVGAEELEVATQDATELASARP